MKAGMKTIYIFLTVVYAFCIFGTQAYAAWWKLWKKKTVKVLVDYPANLVNESVNAVGTTE